MKIKKKFIWMLTMILIVIEQGIKLVINSRYLGAHVKILEPWLYFDPMFNRDYSWFNSMLKLGGGRWIHSISVIILIVLIIAIYRFINSKTTTTNLIDTAFAFLFAGAFCSLIDKVFWNGSLDYILLSDYFTFDLKDVYINVFIGLVILMMIIDHKGIRTSDDDGIVKEFFEFIKGKNNKNRGK